MNGYSELQMKHKKILKGHSWQNSGARTSENPLLHKAVRTLSKIIEINIFQALKMKGLQKSEEHLLLNLSKNSKTVVFSRALILSLSTQLCSSFENQSMAQQL